MSLFLLHFFHFLSFTCNFMGALWVITLGLIYEEASQWWWDFFNVMEGFFRVIRVGSVTWSTFRTLQIGVGKSFLGSFIWFEQASERGSRDSWAGIFWDNVRCARVFHVTLLNGYSRKLFSKKPHHRCFRKSLIRLWRFSVFTLRIDSFKYS